eukprot:SAG31_NODE_18453_length_635_cov_2.921642_1_plen_58_part_10
MELNSIHAAVRDPSLPPWSPTRGVLQVRYNVKLLVTVGATSTYPPPPRRPPFPHHSTA